MQVIDAVIFVVYLIAMLGVGFFFHRKNSGTDDYFVGGRSMGPMHIGLSVVATDVGGGFSIGLGGLGFTMGLSGSWMLFTGLLGAWISAVVLIPRIRGNPAFARFQTLPQVFSYLFSPNVAIIAALISLIGYTGFTSSQLLAGAKLAGSTFNELSIHEALLIMGAVAVIYTVMGGLKAVIYTDTVQWMVLIVGLAAVAIPIAWVKIGGWAAMKEALPSEMLSLTNLNGQVIIYWLCTILPIWFIGMTLYQRIFASRDVKSAQKAWYFAGLLEWPLMAFMGVTLGLLARVYMEQGHFGTAMISDEELGLPMLLKHILPAGLMGLVMSSYFSAILSTADSCLMAASGNLSTDLFGKNLAKLPFKLQLRYSQLFTLIIGTLALWLAWGSTEVLSLMLYSYAFMVSGLLVPFLFGLYTRNRHPVAAATSMIGGGGMSIYLQESLNYGWIKKLPWGLDPNVFGLLASAILYITVSKLVQNEKHSSEKN